MKKLILADDSHTIQRLALLALSEKDIEMFSFCNGNDVIKYVDTVKPDMIVAGTVLEGKSGYEICDHIKHHSSMPHIPVLLLRSRFEPSDDTRAQAVACDGILVKPFRSEELMNWVLFLMDKDTRPAGPFVPEPPARQPVEEPVRESPQAPSRQPVEEPVREAPQAAVPESEIKTPPDAAIHVDQRMDREDLMSFIDREELWNLALDRKKSQPPEPNKQTDAGVIPRRETGAPFTAGKPSGKAVFPLSDGLIDKISEKVAERVSEMINQNLSPAFLKKILEEIIVEASEKD